LPSGSVGDVEPVSSGSVQIATRGRWIATAAAGRDGVCRAASQQAVGEEVQADSALSGIIGNDTTNRSLGRPLPTGALGWYRPRHSGPPWAAGGAATVTKSSTIGGPIVEGHEGRMNALRAKR
jgi:hypothetical protein